MNRSVFILLSLILLINPLFAAHTTPEKVNIKIKTIGCRPEANAHSMFLDFSISPEDNNKKRKIEVNETDDISSKSGTCTLITKAVKGVTSGLHCIIQDPHHFNEVVLNYNDLHDYTADHNGIQLNGKVYGKFGITGMLNKSADVTCNVFIGNN